MVWVYDRTESLLAATLMHGGLTASTATPNLVPATTGVTFDLVPGLGRRVVDRRRGGKRGHARAALTAKRPVALGGEDVLVNVAGHGI